MGYRQNGETGKIAHGFRRELKQVLRSRAHIFFSCPSTPPLSVIQLGHQPLEVKGQWQRRYTFIFSIKPSSWHEVCLLQMMIALGWVLVPCTLLTWEALSLPDKFIHPRQLPRQFQRDSGGFERLHCSLHYDTTKLQAFQNKTKQKSLVSDQKQLLFINLHSTLFNQLMGSY